MLVTDCVSAVLVGQYGDTALDRAKKFSSQALITLLGGQPQSRIYRDTSFTQPLNYRQRRAQARASEEQTAAQEAEDRDQSNWDTISDMNLMG